MLERPDRAGVVLDFDGTLAEIVARPELARPVAGVPAELARLAERYRLVAIVTGRASADLKTLLDVPGVEVLGLYGFERGASPEVSVEASVVRSAVAEVPGAWVEDKGMSVAVHYRQAPDPARARRTLALALQPLAADGRVRLVEGKMVVELVPADLPMKGRAVEALVRDHGLAAVVYAGDDVADLDAFRALDVVERAGIRATRVAVRGAETPPELVEAADVSVAGPAGLLELLRTL